MSEREMFSQAELEKIVNKLAWCGLESEEEVQQIYGMDREDIPRLMKMHGYEWNSDQEVWASTRDVWRK